MNRFKSWAILVWSTVLVWGSNLYRSYEENNTVDDRETVILSILSSYILLAIGGLLTTICTCCCEKQTRIRFEGGFIFLNLIVWIGYTLFTIGFKELKYGVTGPDELIATDPNSYFFAYASMFNVVYLMSSWFKQCILGDESSLTTTQWMLLAASGYLVMAAAATGLRDCKTNTICPPTVFAVLLGGISGTISSVLSPYRSAPLKCQAEIAMILLITWTIAIGVLTFNNGPAVNVNTMYIGIYLCFFLSLNIMTTANYADAVLSSMPYAQVEFGTGNLRGAAEFLDMAYANIASSPSVGSDDPRNDVSQRMLFESVGGSMSSVAIPTDSTVPDLGESRTFNKKVLVGRRQLSRIELWFTLFIASIICVVTLYQKVNEDQEIFTQWIIVTPFASIFFCIFGWLLSSMQKRKWAFVMEGLLIIILVGLWIRGLIAVTWYFTNHASNQSNPFASMTGNELFMTYGSFFTALFLFTKWANASITTRDWLFLSATTGIIFGVVTISYSNGNILICPGDVGNVSCTQVQAVKVFGGGSALLSLLMVFVSFFPAGRMLASINVILGVLLMLIWCVGTYFIVFQEDGVGSNVGPVFFACWASLYFTVDVCATNLLLFCTENEAETDFENSSYDDNQPRHLDEDADMERASSLQDSIPNFVNVGTSMDNS